MPKKWLTPTDREVSPVAIEYMEREGGTGPDVKTTACPACGEPLREYQSLADHLANCENREAL